MKCEIVLIPVFYCPGKVFRFLRLWL